MSTTYGTLTADGSGNWVHCEGPFSIVAAGTWGCGTLVVEIKSRDGTTTTLNTTTAMTSDATGQNTFNIEGGKQVRATLSSSTSPSLKWEIFGYNLIGKES